MMGMMVRKDWLLWGRRGEDWLIRAVRADCEVHLLKPTEAVWVHGESELGELALLDERTMLLLAKPRGLADPVSTRYLVFGHVDIVVDTTQGVVLWGARTRGRGRGGGGNVCLY